MATPMRQAVLEAVKEAIALGKEPKLAVKGPDDVRVYCGKADYTYSHVDAAKEMGEVLVALTKEGKFNDTKLAHGRFAYNLRHNAGVEIGQGARPRNPVVAPEPEPEPVLDERGKLAKLEAQLVLLKEHMTGLETAIAEQRKLADAEQVAEDEAAEAELVKQEEELRKRLEAIAARKAARTPAPAPVEEPVKVKAK